MLTKSLDDNNAANVLDNLPVGVLCVDSNYQISMVNQMAENLLGRSLSLLRGKRLDEVLSKGSELETLVATVHENGGSVSVRGLKLVGPTLSVEEVSASAALSLDTNTVVVSLTPLRGPGEADPKGQSAAMAEVARILGHEVKNPLAGMMGAAQLLARKARDDQQALLSLIKEEGGRIGRILDRFVAFETFFRPRLVPTNVHRVLGEVVELCRASYAHNIEVEIRYDPSLPEVAADPDHLHEAFLNLMKNACEAISETGVGDRVIVETRYRPGVRLTNAENGNKQRGAFEVSICDNGPGIPAEVQEQMFSPFYTTKESGDGVGLAVVAEILSAHGGFVEVDSGEGGACFRLLFPLGSRQD